MKQLGALQGASLCTHSQPAVGVKLGGGGTRLEKRGVESVRRVYIVSCLYC